MKELKEKEQSNHEGLMSECASGVSPVLPEDAGECLRPILPSSARVRTSTSAEESLCNRLLTCDDLMDMVNRSNDVRKFLVGDGVVPADKLADATYLAIVAVPRLINFILVNVQHHVSARMRR